MTALPKTGIVCRFFFTLWISCLSALLLAKSSNTSFLKKRVIERQANQKVNTLLEKVNSNSMQELAHSLEGINNLFAVLGVHSIDQALQKVKNLQQDVQNLLNALEVQTVSAAIDQAKKVRSVVEQLSQLHIKMAQS
ncbi:hypothetical protein EKK58_03900 [Candidatus Dependentiae bacterium]|nr:MAG: hypothetical protein EKK58_03900 [Candidatus Dependentiae bacterium]